MPNQTKYELYALNELLNSSPRQRQRIISDMLIGKSLTNLEDEIAQHCRQARWRIKDALCRCISNKQLTRYVRVHQRDALALLDSLEAWLTAKGIDAPDENCVAVCNYIIAEMEGMLEFMEDNMQKYCDPEMRVCARKFTLATLKVHQDSLLLTAKMRTAGVAPELQHVVLDYVKEFCARQYCTCRELAYMQMLMHRLLNVFAATGQPDWNRKLGLALIYMNFNRIDFLVMCRRYIADDVDEMATLKLQKEKFLWHEKEIGVIMVKHDVGYNLERLSLISGLLEYTGLELKYIDALESRKDVVLPVVDFKARNADLELKEKRRLKIGVSVAVVSFFVRLMIDAGMLVVAEGEVAGTCRMIAAHISTVGAHEVSGEQIIRHLKPKDAKTRDKMEEVLEDMLNKLRGY